MAHSQLYKIVRRFQWPKEKFYRFYNRYFWRLAKKIGKGDYGREIPMSEHRKYVLGIRKFNRQAAE